MLTLGTEGVLRLLERLTPDQRQVLELRLVGGLTIEEIAAIVGKPAGAVKALQRRAVAAIRREIALSGVSI